MYRLAMRLSACTFAVVLCFCALQAIQSYQKQKPFDADVYFGLNTAEAQVPKEQLAQELSAIGNDHQAMICKTSPDEKQYLKKNDIILFSGPTESPLGPVVEGSALKWLDAGLTGEVVSPEDVGTRPLSGTYYASDAPGLRDAVERWASERSIVVDWGGPLEGLSVPVLAAAMLLNASGLLVPAAALFLAASILCLSQKEWRANCVLLVGGVPYGRVRSLATLRVITMFVQGFAVGLVASAAYVFFARGGIEQLALAARAGSETILLFLLVALLVGSLLGAALVPPFKGLSRREGVAAPVRVLGSALTAGGLLVVALGLFWGLTLMRQEHMLLAQSEVYERMADATRITIRSLPSERHNGGMGYGRSAVSRLLKDADDRGILMLSLDVSQSIGLSGDSLDGFDTYVIVNRAYLGLVGVGVAEDGEQGELLPLPDDQVPPSAREYASLWGGEAGDAAFSFWRYEGEGLLALGANTSQGGQNATYANPLVVLVDGPIQDLNYEGFTGAMLSTGNLFFSDGEQLEELVRETGSGEFIASIDRLFELAQTYAQIASSRVSSFLAAAAAAGGVVVAMAAQASMSWSELRKRLVFARRSNGDPYPLIALDGMRVQVLLALLCVATAACGEALGVAQGILPSVALPAALYLVFQSAFRSVFASRAFDAVSSRREAEVYGTRG